jgi:hypothetical protein
MSLFNPTLFLASLRELLNGGVAAVALTEEEILFLANQNCPQEHRLPISDYLAYAQQVTYCLPAELLDTPNTETFYDISSLLKAKILQQKLTMLNAIADGKPNWRRYCWLLERKDKVARQTKKTDKGTVTEAEPEALAQAVLRFVETEAPAEETPMVEILLEETEATPTPTTAVAIEVAEAKSRLKRKRRIFGPLRIAANPANTSTSLSGNGRDLNNPSKRQPSSATDAEEPSSLAKAIAPHFVRHKRIL